MPSLTQRLTSAVVSAAQAFRADSAPVPAAPASDSAPRMDAYYNTQNGMGGVNDRSRYTGFSIAPAMPREIIDGLYRQDGIARKLIDLRALDSLREGWEAKSEGDPAALQAMAQEEKRLKFYDELKKGRVWRRKYGGSAVCMNVEDGLPTWEPMGEPRRMIGLFTVHRWEARPHTYITDPTARDFGKPLLYRIRRETGGGIQAPEQIWHTSRMLIFDGQPLTNLERSQNQGWGDSEYDHGWEALKTSGTGAAAVLKIIEEFSILVLKKKGFREAVETHGFAAVLARVTAIRMGMGLFKTAVVDIEEDVVRCNAAVAGLAEIMNTQREDVAAAWDYPMRRLYGLMPAGLAQGGDTDMQFYYAGVKSEDQEAEIRPELEKFHNVLFRCPRWGENGDDVNPFGGQRPDDFDIEFRPLYILSQTEQEAARTSFVGALVAAATMDIIDPHADARPALAAKYPDMVTEDGADELDEDDAIDLRPSPEAANAAAAGYQTWLASDRTTVPAATVAMSRRLATREPLDSRRLRGLAAWFTQAEALRGDPATDLAWSMVGGDVCRAWVEATLQALDTDDDGEPDLIDKTPEGDNPEAETPEDGVVT